MGRETLNETISRVYYLSSRTQILQPDGSSLFYDEFVNELDTLDLFHKFFELPYSDQICFRILELFKDFQLFWAFFSNLKKEDFQIFRKNLSILIRIYRRKLWWYPFFLSSNWISFWNVTSDGYRLICFKVLWVESVSFRRSDSRTFRKKMSVDNWERLSYMTLWL